jgi:dolichyl-phosphate mannosyltransferase polypeptide 2 regulatory subunit
MMLTEPPQPFFDASSPIHDYFPAREWAIRIPAFVLVVGLAVIGSFVGFTIIKERRKKAQKAKLRNA